MSTSTVQSGPPMGANTEERRRPSESDVHSVPAPLYRHATPSAPWPWMKLDVDDSAVRPLAPSARGPFEWSLYPQRPFENWTDEQVARSQMLTKCSHHEASTVYKVNVFDDGRFDDQKQVRSVRRADAVNLRAFWDDLVVPPSMNVRVQALFVDDMTSPVLKLLGTRYNIEPFFFASATNWIPSRYQEDAKEFEDHITVVLPFIRTLKNQRHLARAQRLPKKFATFTSVNTESWVSVEGLLPYTEDKKQMIDTQAPLSLPDEKILIQDLLSLHMIRNTTTSTIVSYHHCVQFQGTSANRLQSLVQRTGHSVYWSNIFKRSKDPTFLFLAILWYALYAWDEALSELLGYINALESDVLRYQDIKLTRELHKLQAHFLSYQQLLREFHRSVEFVRDTPNPAMRSPSISEAERKDSADLLHTEANNLISEIERLIQQREMMSDRLDNAIHLTFATVNIEESEIMRGLAERVMVDSSTIKGLAWLTLILLPASFVSNVFSMNVKEINPDNATGTIINYVEAVIGLTLFTSWLAIALQRNSSFYPSDSSTLHRALWPLYYAFNVISMEARQLRERVAKSRSSTKFRAV